ncbi:unnamed protein product, partial [Ectocarpus sp. 4 AP-2014]
MNKSRKNSSAPKKRLWAVELSRACPTISRGARARQVQSGAALAFKNRDGTHDVEKVRKVLDVFPSVADMQRCIEWQAKGGIPETSVANSSSSSSSSSNSNNAVGTNAATSGAGSAASAGAAAPNPRTAQAKATATSLARKAATAAATVFSR